MKTALAIISLVFSSFATAGAFETATKVVQDMGYMDTDHANTGCFARATFATLELRNKQIPAFNIFIFGEFYPTDNYFNYHVAAGFFDRKKSKDPFVVDPIFSLKPLTLKEWIASLKPKTKDIIIKFRPAGEFGSPEQIKARPSLAHPEKAPPQFEQRQIAFACQTLHRLLEFHPKDGKQRKLVGRYVYFMDGRDPDKPIEYAPAISCIPEPLAIKKRPDSGIFLDPAWAPSGLQITSDLKAPNQAVLKFAFKAPNGNDITVNTRTIHLTNGFEGYFPVFNDQNPQVPTGFLSLSIVSPHFIRGQLFGTPFVARHQTDTAVH